jgi:hypothetical protein
MLSASLVHFAIVRTPLCDARVRPSKGEDISDEWHAVTCRACVSVAFQRLWDALYPDLRTAAIRLEVPVPKRPPVKLPFSPLPYSSTFEEFRSLARWVSDDPDSGEVAHILPW